MSKSPIKWVGGKGAIAGEIVRYFPNNFRRYYEPFLGGGAIFFSLRPQEAYLSDINGELVNCFWSIRDRLGEVIERLVEHEASHEKEYYYEQRSLYGYGDDAERAARFIYLLKTCFNGLHRLNRDGRFNVSIGRQKRKPTICDIPVLQAASESLQNAVLIEASFLETLAWPQEEDLVYLDPPYHMKYASYNGVNTFTDIDHKVLSRKFKELADRGVKLALSNSDTLFCRELYEGFRIVSIEAPVRLGASKDSRKKAPEILVLANLD